MFKQFFILNSIIAEICYIYINIFLYEESISDFIVSNQYIFDIMFKDDENRIIIKCYYAY